MAKRIAQVDIKIGGIQTIGQLEAELAKMNEEVKKLQVGSKAFNALQKEIAETEGRLKTLNTQMEGVTSTEKAEGILKMGEGFAGALIGIQGLQTALGGTNEELEKTVQRVGGLILAMDGLRRVTEAFSAENIKRLRGVGRSFTTLAKTVKGASLAMRASLLATGIGAIVVAVGLLIANWERLSAIVSNSGRQRQLKKEVKELEKVQEAQQEIVSSTEAEAAARKELVEYNQSAYEAAQSAFDAQVQNIINLQNEYNLNQKNLESMRLKIEGMRETRKKYKEISLEIEKAEKAQKQLNAEYELAQRKLEEMGGTLNNISEITSNEDQVKAVQNLVKAMGGVEFTQRRTYELALRNLNLQLQSIELTKQSNGEYRKGQKEQLAALQAEVEALKGKEALRIRDLKLQLKEIDRGKEYELTQRGVGIEMEKNQIILEQMLVQYDNQLSNNELFLAQKEREAEVNAYILEEFKARFPFDKEGLEILREKYGVEVAELQLLTDLQGINLDLSKLSTQVKLDYFLQVDAMNNLYDAQLKSYELEKDAVKQNIEALYVQQDLQDLVAQNAEKRLEEVQAEREIYQTNLDKAKTLEEQLKWKTKLSGIDAEILGFEDVILDADNEIANLQNEIAEQKAVIGQIDGDILAITEEKSNEEQRITYELEQQLRLSSRAKTFLDEYNEELSAGQELLGASFELWATFADRRAEMASREHELALERVDELNDALEDQQDLRTAYEEELADADGERYDELLSLIAGLKDSEAELQVQRDEQNQAALKAQYDMEVAEWKAEKRRKAASIIEATIQGVIAVVSALPNVILAAVVGALAVAGIATIAAQPVSPKPEKPEGAAFAEGGYTGDGQKHDVAGVVHKGEYVVPKSLVESNTGAEMIGILEGMRTGMKGYAEGGMVTSPTQASSSAAQDFGVIAELIAESLRRNPSVVSVVEVTDRQNKVKVIESKASL